MNIKQIIKNPLYQYTAIFIIIRVLSLATYHAGGINHAIAAILILGFLYIAIKHISLAWIILVGELILDGSGHYFEFSTLILRTWFLGIFAIIWMIQKLKDKKIFYTFPRSLMISGTLVILTILFAVINGFIHQHTVMYILQDAILYFFLFLLFPAIEFRQSVQKYIPIFLYTFIIGSALFSLITLIIYSTGLGHLPDFYYHWFRNIAGGKITDLGQNFFRTVLSEHLFIIPFILILTSLLIDNVKQKRYQLLLLASIFVLALNFSRIYFVALAFGLLILAYKSKFLPWLKTSFIVGIATIIMFIGINVVVSAGQSTGLELLGVKIGGVSRPSDDVSGAIRLAMLPDIFATIKTHPIMGSGLGTTVQYVDPVTHESVSRTQFDWGYFEMIAELGVMGTLIYISCILILLYHLGKKAYKEKNPLYRGLLAGGLALFIINITTPALFQGFGVLYFVCIVTLYHPERS